MKKFGLIVLLFALVAFAACRPEGGFIPDPSDTNFKRVTKPDGSRYVMEIAVYIDAENVNPLNAGDYYLEDGTPYFDYVILGAAQLKRPAGTWRAELFIPPGLQHVLNNRQTLLEPLKQKGKRIILGITGGQDNVSFGTLIRPEDFANQELGDEEPLHAFAELVVDFLNMYQLDGVEFIDTNTVRAPAHPDTYVYPDAYFEGHTWNGQLINNYSDNPWGRIEAWGMDTGGHDNVPLDRGNRQFCLLAALMRDNYGGGGTIFIREINHGAYLVEEPKLFTSRESYLDFYINSEYHSFGVSTPFWACNDCNFHWTLRGDYIECPKYGCENITTEYPSGRSVIPEVRLESYSPLAINLDGIMPPLYDSDGKDIAGFSQLFWAAHTKYELLFYNGLVPASAENHSRFTDTRPSSPTYGEPLTQTDIFSISADIIFGQSVIRDGGNRPKTW